MKNLNDTKELAELHRKIAVIENEIINLTNTMRKLEKYTQEWFSEDNTITE